MTAIFAPTDSTLAVVETFDDQMIRNHIIPNFPIFSGDVFFGGCIDAVTLGGLHVSIRIDEATGGMSINGLQINNDFDIQGDYGVMHGLGDDGILVDSAISYAPCTDFVSITSLGKYSRLVDALSGQRTKLGAVAPVSKCFVLVLSQHR